MKHIKKIAKMTSVAVFALFGLNACDNNKNELSSIKEKKGAFVIISEISPGKYKILEEYPASETRVVLKSLDGSERILSKQEMDDLLAKENAKIENGTSNLTSPNPSISSGGGSLGEILLSSVAGAIIGSWIGNKLFNNPNFQSHKQNAYKNPSAYSRSVNSFNGAKSSSSAKSGFFKSGGQKQGFGG